MDISQIIDPLNKAQRQAVCSEAQNTLVLAGAGSGKTRVLVHRIAWLVQVENISPYSIMAVTFTNKAAGEMRFRIENLLKTPVRNMWVGTFHGLAHRLLRAHWKDANLLESFQIIDSDDQLRLVKRIMKEIGIDDKKHPPREVQWFINDCKDNGLRANQLNVREFHNREFMLDIYQQYEDLCQRAGLVDFAELLLRAHELWLNQPHLLKHYQQRFSHILVDEFQDTNTIQYAWLKVLSGNNLPETNIHTFVVGDDDQSIYGWRGAKIEHIREFSQDFQAGSSETVRLEQNYRSTGNILEAANSVIANNTERLGKELWTDGSEGDLLQVYKAFNEIDEAAYVAGQIEKWVDNAGKRSEIAILYRSNAQSQPHEYELVKRGIPYRVYGGLRFYERAEVKDALAYMRLIANRQDDAALERIINTPTRGIGQRTVENIRGVAREQQQHIWQTAKMMIAEKQLSARAASSVQKFLDLIEELEASTVDGDLTLAEQVTHIVEVSQLKEFHGKENSERAQAKVENLEELVNAAKRFDDEGDPLLEAVKESAQLNNEDEAAVVGVNDSKISLMAEFLAHAALEAGEGQADEWEDCVQLMSLHSAKGLEFELVFLSGMEQGLFPHKNAIQDYVGGRLEEERRLCYVGITRARQQLHLTHAESRTIYGRSELAYPSQFLSEIPASLISQVRAVNSSISPAGSSKYEQGFDASTDDDDEVYIGQRVNHKKFGEGTVIDIEGSGARARVQVSFDYNGTRWLMLNIANLV